MKRVFVVDALASFLEDEDVPAEIGVQIFAARSGVPAGRCDGLVPVIMTRVSGAEMDRLEGLRVIANYGVGYDNIDIAAARARGIVVSNTPGVLTEATAELTWALILAVARRLGEGERMVRAHAWPGWAPTELRGLQLHGRLLGIVGMGRIGRAVAERAAAFGMRVQHWSRTAHADYDFVDLDTLLATSDVVSVHLPKSPATERLVDPRRLKDGAIFINTARGSVVDQPALIGELRSGRIRAGLDVYDGEPNVPEALLALDNVVLLPHLGSATYETRQAMWRLAWSNLLCGLAGEPLLNPVL